MSLRFERGVIISTGLGGDFFPSAEEIYSIVFEGRGSLRGGQAAPSDFLDLGIQFSDSLATPAVIITSNISTTGEPVIQCKLGGKIGKVVEPASLDYIIADNVWYPLPLGTTESFSKLLTDCGISDKINVSLGQYLEIQKRAVDFSVEDHAAQQLAAGTLSKRIPERTPNGLVATPYQYQQTGLQWLGFLSSQGVGSILADEMGLGKTLQVIAVFLFEIQAKRRPNLVLCPATLLENWRRELNRFAPSLSVRIHSGSARTGMASELVQADVTVTSYETMAGDISLFRSFEWNVVALDEAQSIKNPDARRTRRAKELVRRVGIAITGTPVENRLKDLWSICDFILPGHLGTLQEFELRFPDTEPGATALEPFVSAVMLRRRVRDVATDLPARIEVPIALKLDTRSAAAYEEIRLEAMARSPQSPGLAALIYLRMFCAHPWAVGKLRDVTVPTDCSPKMERCFEILEEIFESESKVIIFTSFNEIADLLETEIRRIFNVPVSKINGSVIVPDRQKIVDRFSSTLGGAVLVLNPKAAGVGLNITAASHVIHYNLEWNPAIEDQASARSHRRGQTRPVTIHRLFYADTVEETINERMTKKRSLAEHAVIGTTGDADELTDILNALRRTPTP